MRDDCAATGTSAAYCRTTHLQTQLRGVLRAIGVEPNYVVEQAIRDAARKGLPRAA